MRAIAGGRMADRELIDALAAAKTAADAKAAGRSEREATDRRETAEREVRLAATKAVFKEEFEAYAPYLNKALIDVDVKDDAFQWAPTGYWCKYIIVLWCCEHSDRGGPLHDYVVAIVNAADTNGVWVLTAIGRKSNFGEPQREVKTGDYKMIAVLSTESTRAEIDLAVKQAILSLEILPPGVQAQLTKP